MTRLAIPKTYKLYINGKFPRTESGRSFEAKDSDGATLANMCRASRKDLREAVVAARAAVDKWAGASAYLRGQILYRIAEVLEGRRAQFVDELVAAGTPDAEAKREVDASIDRLVHYAGWSDKYQQVFSAVNPVASSHFSFSVLEPMGVIGLVPRRDDGLLGLVSNLAPAIVGGNTCVLLASESKPTVAVSFAEVLHASDVPAGVVNILTGFHDELLPHLAKHMDVNAVVLSGGDEASDLAELQREATINLKRVIARQRDWHSEDAQSPFLIKETQETKTTWHPIGQ